MIIKKFCNEYKSLVDNFFSGNLVLDNFIKSKDALDPNIGITYIMLTDDEDFIIGYYNITVGRIDYVQYITETNPIYEPMGGAFHINYLCIHENFQRQIQLETENQKIYIGDLLLLDCEERILNISKNVGATFIILYSTGAGYKLYSRNDYVDFEEDMITVRCESDYNCFKMYKCIDDIR